MFSTVYVLYICKVWLRDSHLEMPRTHRNPTKNPGAKGGRGRFKATGMALSLMVGLVGVVWAAETLPGPIPATVIEVVDGDTVGVRARIWLGQDVEIRVRLLDIDAPEMRGKCETERSLAVAARDRVRARVLGRSVMLWDVEYGKYAGRVTARITLADGTDLAAELVQDGFARPYDGGTRGSWCPEPDGGA